MNELPVVVNFVSLGCPKNTVDTERMIAAVVQEGFYVSEEPGDANIIVVNTCGFLREALEETEKVVSSLSSDGSRRRGIIAVGCAVNRLKNLSDNDTPPAIPGADISLTLEQLTELPAACARLAARLFGKSTEPPRPITDFEALPRAITGNPATAYLKISEGCDNRCSYCTIPSIKGPMRSRPMNDVLAEARNLITTGARELVVIAQDTCRYGEDLEENASLPSLLKELAKLEDLRWIRLMYAYPAGITSKLIDALASEKKLCPYLDMPVQHGSASVLRRMARRYDGRRVLETVRELRRRVSHIALRTTVMVGFPGESEEEFDELKRFLEEARFERLGVFTYSREPQTASARMAGQVENEVKEVRAAEILRLQRSITTTYLDRRLGNDEEVLIDEREPAAQDAWYARSRFEAPDVDGRILVRGRDLAVGVLLKVHVTGRKEYDLEAERVE